MLSSNGKAIKCGRCFVRYCPQYTFVGDIWSCTTVFSVVVYSICTTTHHPVMRSLSASILMWLLASGLGGMVPWNSQRGPVTWHCNFFLWGLLIDRVCMASAYSSPVADLHWRGVWEFSLKPRNGETYVPFDDQEVPCMSYCRRTSLWAPRITFTRSQYPHFSVFRFVQIGCGTYATPGI